MTGSVVWSGMWEGYTGEGMDLLGRIFSGVGGCKERQGWCLLGRASSGRGARKEGIVSAGQGYLGRGMLGEGREGVG